MGRTIIYPQRRSAASGVKKTVVYPGDQVTAVKPKPSAGDAAEEPLSTQGEPVEVKERPDEFESKLIKYIPAEVISFYAAVYALIPKSRAESGSLDHLALVIIVLLVGALLTPGYLFIRRDKANPPRPYFYALAILAYVFWTAGVSSVVKDLLGIDNEWLSKFIFLLGVFLVPFFDELVSAIADR